MTWLIFVDELHINFRDTGRVRQLLRSISTELIRDDDLFAMRSSRPSAVAIDASSDRARLEEAIRTVTGAGLHASEISSGLDAVRDEMRLRLGVAFSAAAELLGSVPVSANRRRGMLYISNGYDSNRSSTHASNFLGAARRGKVIVFAMNAGGLPSKLAENAGGDDSRRHSLRDIAEPTGGFAVLDQMDFADAMPRIRAATARISK